jgi:hypothetical protein
MDMDSQHLAAHADLAKDGRESEDRIDEEGG